MAIDYTSVKNFIFIFFIEQNYLDKMLRRKEFSFEKKQYFFKAEN